MIKVFVSQWSRSAKETLPVVPVAFQARQVMEWISENKDKEEAILSTCQEMHCLRILRLIREEVEGVRLKKEEVTFYFDNPVSGILKSIDPTEDGDLDSLVPGGFFTQRGPELF